jgi:transposase, IS5 family
MAEETLYDSEAMRRFAGIELGDDRIPKKTFPDFSGNEPL